MSETAELQTLLNNIIEVDPSARIVCSIGNANHSTLEQPLYYLSTVINRMDGHMSCGMANHANSPVAVMENVRAMLVEHNETEGRFTINRRVFTVSDIFTQVCFKS